MQTVHRRNEIHDLLSRAGKAGKRIGFVPTMGALHAGHISLVERSVKENDLSVVSVYVNPTQFNNPDDLKNYPRDVDRDMQLLEEAGCDLLFLPDDKEMYPEPDQREFDFGSMAKIMEGHFRPGHFNGVAQVVSKLFDAVPADKAYFGQKDFQQLAIIRKLVKDFNYPHKIVACPIIRESDGLAMSSRNMRLNVRQRNAAPKIYETLQDIRKQIPGTDVSVIDADVRSSINSDPELHLEYFQIVHSETLEPVSVIDSKIPMTACIAVYAGDIRLIDNVELNS